jgi:regulator of protease activity HflC (stomatin/prohibitin superfamily)
VALTLTLASIRLVQQYEQGIVFRFGRLLPGHRTPGLALIIPFVDRMAKVNMQIIVMSVPAQGVITRDNVTVTVDAVVYFRVVDPVKALINVQDYPRAVSQMAQTSLRSVIGRAELDTLLSDRQQINAELKAVIDAPTEQPWGVRIERVEVKDVTLPESMKRSMSRQAEAERERRARVIAAQGELQASAKLAQAAQAMAATPGALQLRLLQTVADVASEKNSTLVMPFPVEMLRFFEHSAGRGGVAAEAAERAAPQVTPELPQQDVPPAAIGETEMAEALLREAGRGRPNQACLVTPRPQWACGSTAVGWFALSTCATTSTVPANDTHARKRQRCGRCAQRGPRRRDELLQPLLGGYQVEAVSPTNVELHFAVDAGVVLNAGVTIDLRPSTHRKHDVLLRVGVHA